MKRLIASSAAALTALSAFAGLPGAAAAQEDPGDRVNTLIIYGDDECPQSTPGEITVCARLDEADRYRVPEILRQSEDPANESWAQRVRSFEAVGDFGPLSCTPSGAGGELGCTAELIEAAYQERAQAPGVRFSQLIQQERERRLAEIDAEAAETQARVEEIERQYAERRRAAEEGAVAVDPSPPPAGIADPSRQPPVEPPVDVEGQENEVPRPVAPQIPTVIDPTAD